MSTRPDIFPPHLIAYTIVGTVTDLEEHLKREAADAGTMIDRAEIATSA